MVARRESWLPAHPTASLALTCLLAGSQPVTQAPSPPPAPPPSATMPLHPGPPARQMAPAEVLRVIDGDTVEMRVMIWLDQHVTTRVRIRGIDAPERNGKCPEENRRAEAAQQELERALAERPLFLTDIGRDKYGGRVLARIVTRNGQDIGAAMMAAGVARAYAGGRRLPWCA